MGQLFLGKHGNCGTVEPAPSSEAFKLVIVLTAQNLSSNQSRGGGAPCPLISKQPHMSSSAGDLYASGVLHQTGGHTHTLCAPCLAAKGFGYLKGQAGRSDAIRRPFSCHIPHGLLHLTAPGADGSSFCLSHWGHLSGIESADVALLESLGKCRPDVRVIEQGV